MAAHRAGFVEVVLIGGEDRRSLTPAEVERVAKRGVAKGFEVLAPFDMTALYDPSWNPLWAIAN
jgi:hypothetical protein